MIPIKIVNKFFELSRAHEARTPYLYSADRRQKKGMLARENILRAFHNAEMFDICCVFHPLISRTSATERRHEAKMLSNVFR